MRRLINAILRAPSNEELPELAAHQHRTLGVFTLLALTLGIALNVSGLLLGVFELTPILVYLVIWSAFWLLIRRVSNTRWGRRHPELLFFVVGVAIIAFIVATPWLQSTQDPRQTQIVVVVPLIIAAMSFWRPVLTFALAGVASIALLLTLYLLLGHLDAANLQEVPVCVAISAVGAASSVIVRTIWRDKELSRLQLAASDRMTNLGRMTAGIAHELKTPIAAADSSLLLAGGLVDELERSIGDARVEEADLREIASELRASVDLAARATVRVAEFVRAMRSQTTVERAEAQSRFSVVERIAPIERLMTHGLRKAGIRLEVVGDPATFATGDPGRLDQVLTNLIQNAADSIAESGVGETIRIEVKRMEDDAVAIIVEDNGPGIPDSVRARVFDYLFTTRAQSGGTGIGLALCRDIVVGEFGGCLDLREVAGPHGARFEITLGKPAAPTETSAFQPAQQFAPTANRVELRG